MPLPPRDTHVHGPARTPGGPALRSPVPTPGMCATRALVPSAGTRELRRARVSPVPYRSKRRPADPRPPAGAGGAEAHIICRDNPWAGYGAKRDDQAVELVERLPTADEYVELLRRVGWTSPPVEDCRRALGGSLTAICAVDERKVVVGMGRLVGDGRMYCFAVDVVVDPDAQRQGIGQGIMDALEALVRRRQFGTRLYLVAAPAVVAFLPATSISPASHRPDEKASLACPTVVTLSEGRGRSDDRAAPREAQPRRRGGRRRRRLRLVTSIARVVAVRVACVLTNPAIAPRVGRTEPLAPG